MSKKIETSRLVLRPFLAGDLTSIRAVVENRTIAEMAGFQAANGAFESNYFLKQLMQPNVWAIVLKDGAQVLGSVGLYAVIGENHEPASNQWELGYMLNEDYWGFGYMKEATCAILNLVFTKRPDAIILASTYADNQRSVKVLEYLGFQQTGEQIQPVSVLNTTAQKENFYHLTRETFNKGGHYATN